MADKASISSQIKLSVESGARSRKMVSEISGLVWEGLERDKKLGCKVLRRRGKEKPRSGGQEEKESEIRHRTVLYLSARQPVELQDMKKGSKEQRRRELLILWEAPPIGPPVT